MESSVDAQLRDLYGASGTHVTILTGSEGIELRLQTEGESPEQARRRLRRLEQRMVDRLGVDLYARDDETLPGVVGRRLRALGRTLATAESCTAGLVAGAVTSVPGSSGWFRGGLVVYNDELKVKLAGIDPGLLREHGAVSEAVARALAAGARRRAGADYGLGVTGIAGPGGGSADKPVGLVHLAIEGPGAADHRRLMLIGDRALIRRRTVVAALDRLRRLLGETEAAR
jgi:nicotinamide-nucleotide amidase